MIHTSSQFAYIVGVLTSRHAELPTSYLAWDKKDAGDLSTREVPWKDGKDFDFDLKAPVSEG